MPGDTWLEKAGHQAGVWTHDSGRSKCYGSRQVDRWVKGCWGRMKKKEHWDCLGHVIIRLVNFSFSFFIVVQLPWSVFSPHCSHCEWMRNAGWVQGKSHHQKSSIGTGMLQIIILESGCGCWSFICVCSFRWGEYRSTLWSHVCHPNSNDFRNPRISKCACRSMS